MEGKSVFNAIDLDTISFEDNSKVLHAVNLIKKKIGGKIKVRTCANGSKQKSYLKERKRVSSPRVLFKELFCALIIDAH